jgi:hypothetical protein
MRYRDRPEILEVRRARNAGGGASERVSVQRIDIVCITALSPVERQLGLGSRRVQRTSRAYLLSADYLKLLPAGMVENASGEDRRSVSRARGKPNFTFSAIVSGRSMC